MHTPNFEKLFYIKTFELLSQTRSTEVRFLGYLIRFMSYDNRVYFERAEVANSIGCSVDTITNLTKDLVFVDLMRPNGKNRYMINPQCICKGPADHFWSLVDDFNRLS